MRADVKLTLKQAGRDRSRARTRRRARRPASACTRVKDGDTLPSISYRAYGDATQWRLIAEANGVDNPLHLRRGSSLVAPDAGELMPGGQAEQHVAGIDVLVDGAAMDAEFARLDDRGQGRRLADRCPTWR